MLIEGRLRGPRKPVDKIQLFTDAKTEDFLHVYISQTLLSDSRKVYF